MARLMLICFGVLLGAAISATEVVFEGEAPSNKGLVERLTRDRQSTADSITAVLVREGYLDARVRMEGDTVYVSSGHASIIDSVLWMTDSITAVSPKVLFTEPNVEKIMSRKLARYIESGHFYASASVAAVRRRGAAVVVEARLHPGPLLALRENIFTGLTRTRPGLVARYIPLKSGEPLSEKNLDGAESRAAAIPFLDLQPPLKVRPLPGYTEADLEFVFTEKRQVLISGGGGLTPSGPSNLVWSLDLRFQNLIGGGRLVHLKSERREENRQILQVGYRQPVVLLGVGELGLNVVTRDYRDQFYEFSVKADYRARVSTAFDASLAVGWRSIEPSGMLPSFTSWSSSFTIERIRVDNRLNPRSGLVLVWTVSFGYRRYAVDSLRAQSERNSFNETRTEVQAGWYRPLASNLIGQLGIGFQNLQTGELLPPVSELYYIGGPGSIRGYRNEQFSAARTAFGTLEVRFRFTSGYPFIFYDAAYVNNRLSDANRGIVTDESYHHGYGLGMAIIDGTRLLKISVGWNPDLPFDEPRLSLEMSAEI
jgi:outer membrane protein assembly factor BamA